MKHNSTKAKLQIHVFDDYQNTYGQRGRTKTKHGINDHRCPHVIKTSFSSLSIYLCYIYIIFIFFYIYSLVGFSKSYIKNASVEVVSEKEKHTKSDKTVILI